MMDLASIAANLARDESGIWVSPTQSEVSYPAEGNEACLAVEEKSFWFNHRNSVITSVVAAFSPRETLFDVGGGNGYVSLALQRAGIDAVVVEPGAQGARNAMRRGIKTVVQSTLQDAGFKANSIGAAGLFDVLEHVQDDGAFLRAIHSHLRPGGRLYLTVPTYSALWSVDDVAAGHYRRYTTRSLGERLTQNGFAIDYCSYFFWCLVPPIFLLRALPSRLGLRKAVSMETTDAEHNAGGGVMGTLIDKALASELRRIQARQWIPIGSSCIAAARKEG